MAEQGDEEQGHEQTTVVAGGPAPKEVFLDTFEWLRNSTDPKLAKRQKITIDEVVHIGIPRKHLLSYLEQDRAESVSCQSIPFAFILMVSYALSAIIHEDAPRVSSVEHSLEFHIEENANFAFSNPDKGHKDYADVNSIADFWSWFSLGFVPLVFDFEAAWLDKDTNESWITNNTFGDYTFDHSTLAPVASQSGDGVFLNYQRIIGGVRLRQETYQIVLTPEEQEQLDLATLDDEDNDEEAEDALERPVGLGCTTRSSLKKVHGRDCARGFGYELDPERAQVRRFDKRNPTKERWLYVHDGLDEIQRQVVELEASKWLDLETRRIEISIPQYNAEYGLYTLTSTNFFFSRGGHIFKAIDSLSTYANWYPYFSYMVVDAIFICCLVFIIFRELQDIKRICKKKKCFKALVKKYSDFWNFVDWISVIFGSVFIIILNVNIGYTNWLNRECLIFSELEDPPGSSNWYKQLTIVMQALEQEIHYCDTFRKIMAAYPVVIVLRLFKALSAQPKLALVTNTLANALPDLLHFSVVVIPVFASYAISGLSLFGRAVEDFTTLTRSADQLFRALQGDLDWEELKPAGRYEAAIWLFFFQLILMLILFNILIAILMDSYAVVHQRTKGARNIWDKLIDECTRRYALLRRYEQPIQNIIAKLREDDQVFTKAHLDQRKTIPKERSTNWITASNPGNEKVAFECYAKKSSSGGDFNSATNVFLSTEHASAVGTVIVEDGTEHNKLYILREGDAPRSFAVHLDDHNAFRWYVDSSKVHRDDDELENCIKETDNAPSEIVTPDYLMKALDNMQLTQARTIIRGAVETYYAKMKSERGPADLRDIMHHMFYRTGKLLRATLGEKKRIKVEYDDDGLAISTNTGGMSKAEIHLKIKEGFLSAHENEGNGTSDHQASNRNEDKPETMGETNGQKAPKVPMMGDVLRKIKEGVDTALVEFYAEQDKEAKAKAAEIEYDNEAATAYKAKIDEEIKEKEEQISKAVSSRAKDRKKIKADVTKEISEMKTEEKYVDACKVARGHTPSHGNFVKKSEQDEAEPASRRGSKETKKASKEKADHDTYKTDDLGIGSLVMVRHDQRRVLSSCHWAGLSPKVAEWRKRACGKVGYVLAVDDLDGTVNLRIPDLGDLWFGVAALTRPDRATREQSEDKETRDKRRARAERKQKKQQQHEDLVKENNELERRLEKKKDELFKVHGTIEEGISTVTELKQRLAQQSELKRQRRGELAKLKAQRDALASQKQETAKVARNSLQEVRIGAETKSDYASTLGRLVEENDALRDELREEEMKFKDSRKAAQMEIDNLRRQLQEREALLREQRSARLEEDGADDYCLTWLAGRADAVGRALANEGRLPAAQRVLRRLRETAVQAREAQELRDAYLIK